MENEEFEGEKGKLVVEKGKIDLVFCVVSC